VEINGQIPDVSLLAAVRGPDFTVIIVFEERGIVSRIVKDY
jgi:hypothetical protein